MQRFQKPITGISTINHSRVTGGGQLLNGVDDPQYRSAQIQGLVCLYATQFERNQKRDGDSS